MKETWVKHPSYPIEVSTLGRVQRPGGHPAVLKLDPSNGYLRAGTGKRGRVRRVHTLVLETFVGPKPPGKECRHLDGDRQNNKRSNLKWGTPAEQHRDKLKHGTADQSKVFGPKNGAYKYPPSVYNKALALLASGQSLRAVARATGVSKSRLIVVRDQHERR